MNTHYKVSWLKLHPNAPFYGIDADYNVWSVRFNRGHPFISDDGRLTLILTDDDIKTKRMLKLRNENGDLKVSYVDRNKQHKKQRLMHFIYEICHRIHHINPPMHVIPIDGNLHNVNIDNLELVHISQTKHIENQPYIEAYHLKEKTKTYYIDTYRLCCWFEISMEKAKRALECKNKKKAISTCIGKYQFKYVDADDIDPYWKQFSDI